MDYFSADKLIEPSKGDLIISEPYLPDPDFERTVILICEHDENGTIGFVLNKRANVKLQDVVEEVDDYTADLFVGGPVQQETLHFIHRHDMLNGASHEVVDDTYWGGNYEDLLAMINTKSISPSDIRFFAGYSGWSPGQLMDEMKVRSWIVLKRATSKIIFDWDNQDLWKECLNSMGGKFGLMSNYPKNPRLN